MAGGCVGMGVEITEVDVGVEVVTVVTGVRLRDNTGVIGP
jgi:hypothetical protein